MWRPGDRTRRRRFGRHAADTRRRHGRRSRRRLVPSRSGGRRWLARLPRRERLPCDADRHRAGGSHASVQRGRGGDGMGRWRQGGRRGRVAGTRSASHAGHRPLAANARSLGKAFAAHRDRSPADRGRRRQRPLPAATRRAPRRRHRSLRQRRRSQRPLPCRSRRRPAAADGHGRRRSQSPFRMRRHRRRTGNGGRRLQRRFPGRRRTALIGIGFRHHRLLVVGHRLEIRRPHY